MANFQPGDIIDNRYEIIAPLGEGGMGAVFRAQELGLERLIALKVLQPLLISDDEVRQRFQQEGKILSSLVHPNLPIFYRFGLWQQSYPYIAMELLSGITLRELLDQNGSVPPTRLIPIVLQICSAMDSAHKVSIVHRDLKPSNIMLVDAPRAEEPQPVQDLVKILDFGLARVTDPEQKKSSQHLTQTGALIGTTYYMSPEQCVGKQADGRADIYALGCIMYESVTGNPPFTSDNPIGLMHLHVSQSPQPVASLARQSLPPGLSTLIHKALLKDPDSRYQSMMELAADLELIQTGKGEEVQTAHPNEATVKSRPSVGQYWLAGGGVSLAACAFFLFTKSHDAFETVKPPTIINHATSINNAPADALAKALALSNWNGKIPESEARDRMSRAITLGQEALPHLPNDRALAFQAHLTMSTIYNRDLQFRIQYKIDDKQSSESLLALCEKELNQALQFARKPDGNYYRPAYAAFNKLAEVADQRNDQKRRKQCYLKSLELLKSLDTEAFPMKPRLLGYETGDVPGLIKRYLGRCAESEGDYVSAQRLYQESFIELCAVEDILSTNAMDAAVDLTSLLVSTHQTEAATKFEQKVEQRLQKERAQGLIKIRDVSSYSCLLSTMALIRADLKKSADYLEYAVSLMDAASPTDLFSRVYQSLGPLEKACKRLNRPDPRTLSIRQRLKHLQKRK